MSGHIAVRVSGSRRFLLVNGVVQSVTVERDGETGGFWPAMLPRRRPDRVLILGLGGGTLVHLLHRRFGPLAITGVDDDREILEIGRRQFGLERERLCIVEQDALAYLKACHERFDLVLVDLFRGEALPESVTSHTFLRRLRAVLLPGGVLVWNLHRDRRGNRLRRRLQRTLHHDRTILAGLNLVLHLRRRKRALWRRERLPSSRASPSPKPST